MDKEVFYHVKRKKKKKIEKLAENIYNMIVVIDYFCKNQDDIEELSNITPIIKNLRHDADMLCVFFINYFDTLES